jgi:hypothetical protein
MQDHRFAGKTVLPAVESLRHLAGAAVDFQKDLTGRVMGNAVFVLDAAFHAASVWVQRYRGFVGFPVSFGFRVIADPADPGEICSALLIPLCPEVRKQSFDIWIRGSDGRICEYVKEMGMRDVFAGRKTPPAWIKSLA